MKWAVATAIFSSLLLASFCFSDFPKWTKLIFSMLGIGSTLAGGAVVLVLRDNRYVRITNKEIEKETFIRTRVASLPGNQCAPQIQPLPNDCGCDESDWIPQQQPQQQEQGLQLYDWNDLEDEAVGIVIAGQSGSGKTSVASWVLGKLTEKQPARIKVCDPHYNDIWKEIGLDSIGEFDEIQAEFKWLIAELDRRRQRKKNGQPLGDNLIVVADEIGACIESFEDPKIISKALKRIGSEGRKFGIILIAIDQSPNSDDLGISAKKRDNYLMIGLCSVAIALAKQEVKSGDPLLQFLSLQAYPCVVKMGGILTPASHPTHYEYQRFKKQGNPPRNLLPINQIRGVSLEKSDEDRQRLETLYSMDCSYVATNDPPPPVVETCPHCGSYNIKWLSKNAGRKQCKDCSKTWSIKG